MKVLAALPPDYRDVILFASLTGWRKSEVSGLRWDEVDVAGKQIRFASVSIKESRGPAAAIDRPARGADQPPVSATGSARGEPSPIRVYARLRREAYTRANCPRWRL